MFLEKQSFLRIEWPFVFNTKYFLKTARLVYPFDYHKTLAIKNIVFSIFYCNDKHAQAVSFPQIIVERHHVERPSRLVALRLVCPRHRPLQLFVRKVEPDPPESAWAAAAPSKPVHKGDASQRKTKTSGDQFRLRVRKQKFRNSFYFGWNAWRRSISSGLSDLWKPLLHSYFPIVAFTNWNKNCHTK